MIKNVCITVLLIACVGLVWTAAVTASGIISGKVLETMNSGSYTYVLLDSNGEKVWLAIPETKEKIVAGKTMNFKQGMEMTNFESKSLKRTFDTIIFSEGIESGKGTQSRTPSDSGSAPPSSVSGKVIETLESAGYTYIRIESSGKKLWVAVPAVRKKVAKGQVLHFEPGAEMKDFESKTLNRKFDRIVFSGGIIEEGSIKGSKKVAPGKISVEKAKGANSYTIAELMADRNKLNHKNVIVRGKIVKASKEIMDRNWYHLQDGTSDPKKGPLDLMVTSQDVASVGDDVVVNGMFFAEKDFGAGYKFEGVIENATVEKSPKTKAGTPKDAEGSKADSSPTPSQEEKKTE